MMLQTILARRGFGAVVGVCALVVWSPAAQADMVFDNFGGSHDRSSGFVVAGPSSGQSDMTDQAMSFTVDAGGNVAGFNLTSIDLALNGGDSALFHTLQVTLYSSLGGLPGVQLASEVLTTGTRAGVETATFGAPGAVGGSPFLENGATYWVVLSGVDAADVVWLTQNPGQNSNTRMSRGLDPLTLGMGGWTPGSGDGAFSVGGSLVPIPAPAAAGLALFGLFLLGRVRRRAT